MGFGQEITYGPQKRWLNFGSDLEHMLDVLSY